MIETEKSLKKFIKETGRANLKLRGEGSPPGKQARWRAKNKEKLAEYMRDYRRKNRAK